MALNAATAYKDSKILTASPAELTLLLYDGAVKFCNLALIALEKKELDKVNSNLIKAQNIIRELQISLERKYPVSNDFYLVYDYIYRTLISANIKKEAEIIEEALKYIREMRDTWKSVMKTAKA